MIIKSLSPKEPRHIAFFKLGGTWDMIKINGKLVGSGTLDDEALYQLENSIGFFKKTKQDMLKLELTLAKKIEEITEVNSSKPIDLAEHLKWVPKIAKRVRGKFIPIFSGDSSHLRPSLIAPFVSHLLKFANTNPSIQITGAQGTDSADISIITLLDAFIFDTNFLPFLFTGSNRSHHEWNSDAPKNFIDLTQVVGANLPAGAYWIFGSHIYRASDFVKIDPLESRRIENYTTFFSPRLTARYTKKVVEENHIFRTHLGNSAPKNHVLQKINTTNLYHAITQVGIVDLGDQRNTHQDFLEILDDRTKAVIIAAHSLGNVNNPIKYACVQAALKGKLIIVVSRSLIGEVNERYAASLLGVNEKDLLGSGKFVLSGHKMNKNVAKAVVTRAILEGFDQRQTQTLINTYCESRALIT
jgi:L-asparaginase/Glu-tRNA(Gln) amidotransferase subunit D